jgi:sugar phosphate isomerase/epimerase
MNRNAASGGRRFACGFAMRLRFAPMKLGYNTNGLAHHRWDDAIVLIAAAGYRSVAITVDHHCLDPQSASFRANLARMRSLLEHYELSCVIETGARFLLNPCRKHDPTLLSPTRDERQRRIGFLVECVEIGHELSADAVSFWSGAAPLTAADELLWQRLVDGCHAVLDAADKRTVRLAFEPEPGMFVETCDQYAKLADDLNHPLFGLTLDIGHVHCLSDGAIPNRIRQFADRLFNVHIEDMRPGVHEHLPFGQGTIDFPPVFAALREIGYQGGVHVELSRDSHRAPDALRESFEFLNQFLADKS